jgi:hypothetical protein
MKAEISMKLDFFLWDEFKGNFTKLVLCINLQKDLGTALNYLQLTQLNIS